MCSTTSEFNTSNTSIQHLPFPGVEQPQTRCFAAAGALAVVYPSASMVHQCAFGLEYMSPLRKKYVSTSIRT